MLEDETALAEETGEAMRELASTVTDAPPLRLAPRRSRATRPARQRSWKLWAVPLTAAVAVVALAVALAAVRDMSTAPPTHPAPPPVRPATAPTYYVGTTTTCGPDQEHCPTPRLVVGDTYTGARLATITSPGGSVFGTVSGAADDRTFVTDTFSNPDGVPAQTQPATWYLVKIRPGSATPARLIKLPIRDTLPAAGVQVVALSASGRELAVLYHLGSPTYVDGTSALRIYSVATGQLLHTWSTGRKLLFGTDGFSQYEQTSNLLHWVDGDRAVAFTASPYTQAPNGHITFAGATTVRVLDLTASGHDLIADSRAAWSMPASPPGDSGDSGTCDQSDPTPSLAANGQTVVCTGWSKTETGSGRKASNLWRMTWLTYQTSAPKTAHIVYQATSRFPATDLGIVGTVLWTDPSGSTMIIAWIPSLSASSVIHFGLVRQGTFTPLPTAPGNPLRLVSGIAW